MVYTTILDINRTIHKTESPIQRSRTETRNKRASLAWQSVSQGSSCC